MEKVALTLRLAQDTVARLEYMARLKPVSRQVLMEQILTDAASTTVLVLPMLERRPLPQAVLDAVNASIARLKLGQETSLKKLVGKTVWGTLDDSVKRLMGKEFKDLVIAGEFPGIEIGRKKSNNEQQYDKV